MPPSHVYKGGGGGGRPRGRRTMGGSPTRTANLVGFAPLRFPSHGGEKREGRGKRRRKGGHAPSPSPIRTPYGRGRDHPLWAASSLPYGLCRPITSPGVPVTPGTPEKIPGSHGTIPMSEYNLTIYRSLCLDHFETPCHVRYHIRDFKQSSVHHIT